jgi:hypothetical protein
MKYTVSTSYDDTVIPNDESALSGRATMSSMNKIYVDDALRARLHGLAAQLELCDESGSTLGYFVPRDVHDILVEHLISGPVTDEELERASQMPGGRTTAEVLERLHNL